MGNSGEKYSTNIISRSNEMMYTVQTMVKVKRGKFVIIIDTLILGKHLISSSLFLTLNIFSSLKYELIDN